MGKPLHVFGMVTAVVASLLLLAGCLSDNPGSSSIAYVNISSHAAAAIRAETVRVFADDNYGLTLESGGQLVFERKGTQRDQIMYGRYDESLVMRVVVSIESQRQGSCVLRADAYALHDRDETKVLRIARRPYQDLLNRVKANLLAARGAERDAPQG